MLISITKLFRIIIFLLNQRSINNHLIDTCCAFNEMPDRFFTTKLEVLLRAYHHFSI